MQESNGRLLVSPSDLSNYLSCPHLTQLEYAVARGELRRPVFPDPRAEILRQKGFEHEAAYLARVAAQGRRILRVPSFRDPEFSPEVARRITEEAIRAPDADVVYQPYLTDGTWRGFADFLERLSDGTWEPVDTKLARASRPEHVLQLCFYAEQLARIQGRRPEHVHLELGSGVRESFRTAEFMAYFRQVRARFLEAVAQRQETYPWPCEHCGICAWRRECHRRLVADDNLVLVAGLSRAHVPRLEAAGVHTLERLGDFPRGEAVEGIRRPVFEGFRHQAELQLEYRRTGRHRVDLLPLEAGRGFNLLPRPSTGDVWLDFEAHPFFEAARGLEYLIGSCHRAEDGTLRYAARWARDRESERQIFESFVDWVVARRRRHPDMHLYHYGDYDRSALLRLMAEHGTRENEIDDLLRGEVIVDLFRVTRQALRASVDSYSIKKVEALYGFERRAEVTGGAESTVLFEQWLELQDPSLLAAIARYNEDDCRSAVALHEWLLSLRPGSLAWRLPPGSDAEADEGRAAANEAREAAERALLARSGVEGDTPWVLAQLLEYHRREGRPEWWRWFNHLEMDEDELIADTSALAGLEPVGEPVADKRSLVYTFTFPEQDHKIDGSCADAATESAYKVKVDDEQGRLWLRRAQTRADEPLPRALIPSKPINDAPQREAMLRMAQDFLAGSNRYPALVDVLERRPPRADLTLDPPDAARSLQNSYLFVQGPPGSGKTWQGARAAVALMRAGQRIGIMSQSHKGINHLLTRIEREAQRQSFAFRGRKKHTDEDQAHRGPFIDSSDDPRELLDSRLQLVAGTAWLFAREEFDRTLDTLFIDEAGQVSLADAIASGTAARNLVLLGDPNQLPQVSKGAQPEQAKRSVLQHLLGDDKTVRSDRGIFLEHTWRLRSELCAFTSEAYYESRLQPAAIADRRSMAFGNGPTVIAVEHEGRSQSSREEADAIASEIQRMLGTSFTDDSGVTRPIEPSDILVVAPYNAQVRMLRSRLPDGVRIGTVDKFQGQEAPVVLVSFASSTGADAPRGIQFAFDRNRVNVATSRGQCKVAVVCAPRLLQADCRRVDHMRLVNALCRFAELAGLGPDGRAVAGERSRAAGAGEAPEQIRLF